MKLPKTILDIAKEARRRCEVYAQSDRSGPKHYHEQDDLRCMCATASAVLFEMLKAEDLKSTYCNGHYRTDEKDEKMDSVNHCWLEVDGKILDITATQFGKSAEVYVTDADAARYNKKNEILDWQTMEWQWAQKPTPSIVTEIISVGEITESNIVELGMARTLLNEALDQSVFYTDDIEYTVRDSDTGTLYTGKPVVYHGDPQLVVVDRNGTVIGWLKYSPPTKNSSFFKTTLVMDVSFTKELIRTEAAISEGLFTDEDAMKAALECEKKIELHIHHFSDKSAIECLDNKEYGVSPRYIVYMPRLLWERLARFDEAFNVTPDGFLGSGGGEVALSLPSNFIAPHLYMKFFKKALEAVGAKVTDPVFDKENECWTYICWHLLNKVKITDQDF